MKDLLATAMGRALEETRAGNPTEATRLIQAAMRGETGTNEAQDVRIPMAAPRRRPLGQVIDSLVNGRRFGDVSRGTTSARPSVPLGARYLDRRHESAHGNRDYRVYVPSARATPVRGVIMMLHGCTQTADDFAVGTRMNQHGERENLIVVYPEQTRGANQMGCWNWFRPEDQGAARGEPALLADLALSVATEFDVPGGRIYAAGLSAGGAMAAILGAAHPQTFAAVGVHSGLAPGSASNVAGAFAAMQGQGLPVSPSVATSVPSIVFHGVSDTTVSPRNADAVIQAAIGETSKSAVEDRSVPGALCTIYRDDAGRVLAEDWRLDSVGHAWSGGAPEGSYTHASGPDASAEMMRFFLSTAAEDRS